jgi:hypothetical protein
VPTTSHLVKRKSNITDILPALPGSFTKRKNVCFVHTGAAAANSLRPDRQMTMPVQCTEPPMWEASRWVGKQRRALNLPRRWQGNAGHLNLRDGSPPGGSDVSSRTRGFSRTRNQDQTGQDNMLAGVLKQIACQMVNMTLNQSYLGTGHKVKEAYRCLRTSSIQK